MLNLPSEQIQSKIYNIRNKQVMLASDIAKLYDVETKYLNRQVKRHIERFDEDFMFQLTKNETENLKCQIGTSSWGGARTLPFVFTEQGVYMLATVINSDIAIETTKAIMRTFTKIREFALSYESLVKEINSIKEDNKVHKKETLQNTKNIKLALEYLQHILEDTKETEEKVMGFRVKK